MALFHFIDGIKIKKIKNNDVKKLAFFINSINKNNKFNSLPYAVDGIKHRKNHLKLCESKINEMKKIKNNSDLSKDFFLFLNNKIIPKFIEIKKNFLKKQLELNKFQLFKNDLIVSPSDFGFHNAIKSKDNFFFLDFEYAGLDDPIKLICDFYCQPDQSLTSLQKKIFIKNLSFKKYSIRQLQYLTKIFIPIHRIKWCCIILNEFKNNSINSNKKLVKKNAIMRKQLSKAKNYFKKNFET